MADRLTDDEINWIVHQHPKHTGEYRLACEVRSLRAELKEAVALVRRLIPPGSVYNTEGYE